MKKIFINNEFVECANYGDVLTKEIIEFEYITSKLSSREIGQKYKINKSNILFLLKKYNVPARTGHLDLVNEKFGYLTVIKRLEVCNNNQINWLCLCDCGCEVERHTHSLKHNDNISCGCKNKKPLRDPTKENGKYLPYQVWNTIVKGAIARKFEIVISFNYVEELLEKQNFKCALTGIDLVLPKNHIDLDAGLKNLSLDRIDSTKGYIEGNVRWVHKWINTMRLDFTDIEFIYLCSKVAENNTLSLSDDEKSYIEATFDLKNKEQMILNFKQTMADNQRKRIKEKQS